MDDVVGNSTFQTDCINLLQQNKEQINESNFQREKWFSLDEEHHFQDFCTQMLNIAGSLFDL